MKDYKKLCPKLEKYIPETTLIADLAPKFEVKPIKPNLTKERVEQAYAMLKVDPQYQRIAYGTGLTVEQVKELHQEMTAYQNWSEPEIITE